MKKTNSINTKLYKKGSVIHQGYFLPLFILLAVAIFLVQDTTAGITDTANHKKKPTSTQEEAIRFIDSIHQVEKSNLWPNVKPDAFLENLNINIRQRLSMYPGQGTNFCGYGALTYLLLQDDPLGFAKFMLRLYQDGTAIMGKETFTPGENIRIAAGALKYKGLLDIRPAEQMLYLTLADHFKGYLNIFNRHYDPGDENRFWASVNYAKFNRMVRHLLNYQVNARGSDIFQPSVGNTFDYISRKLNQGTIVLYLNNRILHKKKHERIKLGVPTHFVILESIRKDYDFVTMVFWDYGGRTLLQIKPEFLHKIIFGISLCTKKGHIE